MKKRLIAKCVSCMTALIMATGMAAMPSKVNAENIITNSTFDNGTSGWGIYKESGGNGTLTTDNGRLALNITSVGKVNYAVQVYYDIIPLYENGVYKLKYDISSTVDRYAEAMIQQNGGTYQSYVWDGINLTSEPQTIEHKFTMSKETDIMSKLVFNCGIQKEDLPAHTIYIDNVSLELIDDSNVDYSSIRPYEPPIVTNQIGYKPDSNKIAVFRAVTNEKSFSVVNADTKETVFTGELYGETYNPGADETDYFGDFSSVTKPGKYYITCGDLDASYTFEIGNDIYGTLLDDTVKMLYLQRCGTAVNDDVFGHVSCHDKPAVIYGTNQTIDVNGGWHDAGDYGRYVVPGAKAIADLLYAYSANPELYGDDLNIPESGNDVPDILDEVRYELEWMLKMQAESGGVYHKVTCENFPGYVMPEQEKDQLIVTPVTTTATADFCASMAMAYEFYYDIDRTFAETCLSAAEKAWTFLEANPNLIYQNPEDITTGDYGDKSDRDERYWATAQMYRATKSDKYLNVLNSSSISTGLDWSTVGNYGNIAILTMDESEVPSDLYNKVKNSIVSQANSFVNITQSSPYGVAVNKFNWGSNMTVANAGIVLGLAGNITGDEKYTNAAKDNLNYLLGKNPLGVCFVTGYGTVSPQNPHHRPSMAKNTAMKGMLVGGVNSSKEDSAAKAYLAGVAPAKCYVDHSESYSTNEITIYWNSPLTYLLSLTETEATTPEIIGDIDNSGDVNSLDIVMLQKYLVNLDTLTADQGLRADICKDGKLNVFDMTMLRDIITR